MLTITEYYARFNVNISPFAKIRVKNKLNDKILEETLILKKDVEQVNFPILEKILEMSEVLNIKIAHILIEDVFNKVLSEKIRHLDYKNPNPQLIQQLIKIIDFANHSKLSFKRKEAENKMLSILEHIITDSQEKALFSTDESQIICDIIKLAAKININTDRVSVKYKKN